MDLSFFITLGITSFLAWWLSGFDSRVTGQDPAADFKRRALRCGVTLILVGLGASGVSSRGLGGGFMFIAIVVPLGVIWAGCLSEVFARCFHHLIDSHDPTPFDPKQLPRELDRLAGLVRTGRNEEAIKLCAKLTESGEASALAMEAMLFRLYNETFADARSPTSPALAEAQRLRTEGRYVEAEDQLNLLRKQAPGNLAATMVLLKVYSHDLRRPDKAEALLQALAQQPDVPPGFVDFARRSINESLNLAAKPEKGSEVSEGIESLLVGSLRSKTPEPAPVLDQVPVADLLADGHLGTAIEILECRLHAQPEAFELWLQLAEAHGRYCRNLKRAGDIVAKIEANPAFRPEQIQVAKLKLQEWRAKS